VTDIVARLRAEQVIGPNRGYQTSHVLGLFEEAANEIVRLRYDLALLGPALEHRPSTENDERDHKGKSEIEPPKPQPIAYRHSQPAHFSSSLPM
jgi:hypothetical protein